MAQLQKLLAYVQQNLPKEAAQPPLQEPLEALQQIIDQDLEPDPDDPKGRKKRIRRGVAKGRRVSVKDPDMAHGRKSRTKAFNGFKQHVLIDVDRRLILACAVLSANRREHAAMPSLRADLDRHDVKVDEVLVDRGYTTTAFSKVAAERDWTVLSKPRQMPPNGGRFTKREAGGTFPGEPPARPSSRARWWRPGGVAAWAPPAGRR